jgi:DNA polymerase-3 subunit beta
MKFQTNTTNLAKALTNVSRAVSTKSSIAALEGILIEAYGDKLSISGYNLEIGITTTIDATIQQEGEIVVDAKMFLAIAKKLPEEVVSIESNENYVVTIQSGMSTYEIVGIPSVEYPDLPTLEETSSFEIKGETLKNMIRQTVYAVSDNMQKPVYTGSLFEIKNKEFKIVAIDGFRMSIRQETVDTDIQTEFIVPGKTQQEVLKLIADDENVSIIIGMRHIMFKINNYSVISRLIDGSFLDYNAVIPKGSKTEIVLNTRLIINAVERMSLLNNDKFKSPVKFELSNDEIKLSCSSSIGKANDSITAPINGEEVIIGFNHKFLLDALKNIDSDEVKIIINGSTAPMIITPKKDDSFINIVVPMRLAS